MACLAAKVARAAAPAAQALLLLPRLLARCPSSGWPTEGQLRTPFLTVRGLPGLPDWTPRKALAATRGGPARCRRSTRAVAGREVRTMAEQQQVQRQPRKREELQADPPTVNAEIARLWFREEAR